MRPIYAFLFIFALLCSATTRADESTQETLALARLALGGEKALSDLKALRLTFRVKDAQGKPVGLFVSEYKSPNKSRDLDYTTENLELITGTNGIEGFRTLHNINTGQKEILIMREAEVRIRSDFAADALRPFTRPHSHRGELSPGKNEVVDGITCKTLYYHYKTGVTVVHFIDATAGREVAVRVDSDGKNGALQIYSGQDKSSGITLPKTITLRDAQGKTSRTLTLEKAQKNPSDLTDDAFSTPIS